jgi:hypothetical protein
MDLNQYRASVIAATLCPKCHANASIPCFEKGRPRFYKDDGIETLAYVHDERSALYQGLTESKHALEDKNHMLAILTACAPLMWATNGKWDSAIRQVEEIARRAFPDSVDTSTLTVRQLMDRMDADAATLRKVVLG